MQIVITGKSAAIRITVPRVNSHSSFDEEIDNVKAALYAVNRFHNISRYLAESAGL